MKKTVARGTEFEVDAVRNLYKRVKSNIILKQIKEKKTLEQIVEEVKSIGMFIPGSNEKIVCSDLIQSLGFRYNLSKRDWEQDPGDNFNNVFLEEPDSRDNHDDTDLILQNLEYIKNTLEKTKTAIMKSEKTLERITEELAIITKGILYMTQEEI